MQIVVKLVRFAKVCVIKHIPTDTESDPIETPESPHTVASPTLLLDSTPPTCHVEESEGSDTSGARSTSSDSTAPLLPDHPLTHTTPTLVPVLCRTTRIAMRVLPVMSAGLSAGMAEVVAMSDLALRKRFWSSYESSPIELPSRKRYQGMFELVEDVDEEGDDKEEDEEMEESSNSNSVSEDAKDRCPTAEDEDPIVGDEGLAAGDEGPSMVVKSLSLGEDEAVPGGQQRAAPVAETVVGEPLGLGYGALRRREIALGEGQMPSTFEDGIVYINVPAYQPPAPPAHTPPSPEWSSGSLPISPAPSIVPSPISSPMIPLTVPSLVASPATAETEGFLTELYDRDIGELFTRSRAVRDEIFSQRYRFRSQMDAHRAALWHDISDTQRENWELRLQLADERCAWLDLAEIIDSMRRGQEPRGDV
ncbi:hypothetical protein Tco_0444961 [Tanacetum coccineum]